MLSIPESFAHNTIAREGDAGRRWIAQLPTLFAEFCRRWQLTVDGAPLHGYLGMVLPVRRGDERCMLKLSWRDTSSAQEALALAAWDGNGAVRLLDVDPAQGALLLERLDWRRSLHLRPVDEAIVLAGRLLRRLAIPAPSGLRAQADLAAEMYANLALRWEQLGRPFARKLLDAVSEIVQEPIVCEVPRLVNYDLHYDNVLAGERETWLAIDPKVIAGDPAFGLAQLLWTRLDEVRDGPGVDRLFRLLVEAAEVDPVQARAWTLARTVDYWLWALSVGFTHDPVRCAILADRLFPIL